MKLIKPVSFIYLILTLLFSPLVMTANADECEGQCSPGIPTDTFPGGSHELFTDKVPLYITKTISLDSGRFFSAATSPAAIPEKQTTTVYVSVTVENPNDVSLVDIDLTHDFLPGLSDMVPGSTQLLSGNVEYFGGTDTFHIPKLPAKYSVSFLYKILIQELGQSSQLGNDLLTVTNYQSNLQIFHEGLDYVSLGQKFPSYFLAMAPGAVSAYNNALANGDNPVAPPSGGVGGGSSADGSSDVPTWNMPPKLIQVGMSSWMLLWSMLMSFVALTLYSRVNYRRKTSAAK